MKMEMGLHIGVGILEEYWVTVPHLCSVPECFPNLSSCSDFWVRWTTETLPW